MDSLRLTKGQQDILAEMCSLASTILDKEIDLPTIGDKFNNIIMKASIKGCTSQYFDRMFDLLYKSGANR